MASCAVSGITTFHHGTTALALSVPFTGMAPCVGQGTP
jgi:hypothetical protein